VIPLMKNTFLREQETKEALANFIGSADKLSMGEQCRRFEEVFAAKQGRGHSASQHDPCEVLRRHGLRKQGALHQIASSHAARGRPGSPRHARCRWEPRLRPWPMAKTFSLLIIAMILL
jgi:hypothetical protein